MKFLQSNRRWHYNLISRVSKIASFSTASATTTTNTSNIARTLTFNPSNSNSDVKQIQLERMIKQLRSYNRFQKAPEMSSEWMSSTKLLDLKPDDMAVHFDLISKVYGTATPPSAWVKPEHEKLEKSRKKLLDKLMKKCWNLMGHDKVRDLAVKVLDHGGIGELRKGMELMTLIILKKSGIPYGSNTYMNEMRKVQGLLSNMTNSNTLIESVRMKSIYQSASMIAHDIASQLSKKGSFVAIANRLGRDIPRVMKNRVEGFRITCSGRINGAEIAKTDCFKYGKTSRASVTRKADYAFAKAPTRYGILGVKVWVWYKNRKRSHS